MVQLTKPKFLYALALVSILGFTAIIVQAWSGTSISEWINASLFMIIGLGLLAEGGIRQVLKYQEDGFSKDEVSHIVAIVVGLFAIIVGILSLPIINFTSDVFNGIKIVVASIAIIVILIETFLVK